MASQAQPDPSRPSDLFAVHVFIHHEPYVASALLPSLFSSSTFPDELWKLPPLEGVSDLLDARHRLGRYVLPSRLPGSTCIAHVAEIMETEFKIDASFQAGLKLFPPSDTTNRTDWHGKVLPRDAKLDQAYSHDDYKQEGKLHLVLETKATAIGRIAGVDFIEDALGDEYRATRLPQNRDTFDAWHQIGRFSIPVVIEALFRWRETYYKLKYLNGIQKQLRLEDKELFGSDELVQKRRNVEEEAETLTTQKQEAIADFQLCIQQWREWVFNRHLQAERAWGDDDIEPAWEDMRRERNQLADAWKNYAPMRDGRGGDRQVCFVTT